MFATSLERRHYENAREVRRVFYEETISLLLAIYADCRIIVGATEITTKTLVV
jgi:hypothetical protein